VFHYRYGPLDRRSDHRYNSYMEPAASIIKNLGGDTVVASITGVHRTRVANWKRPKEAGGTGGAIPFRHVPALIKAANDQGIALSADDFLPNAKPLAVQGEAA
jgi:hypothetical protein